MVVSGTRAEMRETLRSIWDTFDFVMGVDACIDSEQQIEEMRIFLASEDELKPDTVLWKALEISNT